MTTTRTSERPKKARKTRKCRICRQEYAPRGPMQRVCSPDCAVNLAVLERNKRELTEKRATRKEIKARKEKLKGRRDYLREAQVAWNSYVRARDFGKPCASCGAMPEQKFGGTMDCSHYRSVGAAPHLRFHLHNAAAACVRCNRHLAGNIAALRVGLIERNGLAKVEAVEANNTVRKFDIEYLKRIKKIFARRAKLRELKRGET